MGVAADIRKKLTVCADCVNCKLVVWPSDDETDIIADRTDISTYRADNNDKYHYAVHCSWLKQKMPAAQKLIKCEGKQPK